MHPDFPIFLNLQCVSNSPLLFLSPYSFLFGHSSSMHSPSQTDSQTLPLHLTHSQAKASRLANGSNDIPPPFALPKFLCCLLRCLSANAAMNQYTLLVPPDAEILRDGSFLVQDASSVVVDDILLLREGDVVPADCELLLPWSLSGADPEADAADNDNVPMVDGRRLTQIGGVRKLQRGGSVLAGETVSEGSFLARVTKVGRGTQLAKRIATRSYPFGKEGAGGMIQMRGGKGAGGG